MGVTGGSGGAHGTQGHGRNARGLCHEKAPGVLLAALLSVHPLGVRYDTLTFGYKQHATTREHSTAALRRQRVGVASAEGIGRPVLAGPALLVGGKTLGGKAHRSDRSRFLAMAGLGAHLNRCDDACGVVTRFLGLPKLALAVSESATNQ